MSITDISPQALSALKEQREQLWYSIEAILEENERLRAELVARPVAVEVPPLDSGANPNQRGLEHPGSGGWLMHQTYLDGYNAARKAARSIPYYRILKDGEVAVRADILSAMNGCIATLRADAELIPSRALDYLDALRSKGGE